MDDGKYEKSQSQKLLHIQQETGQKNERFVS